MFLRDGCRYCSDLELILVFIQIKAYIMVKIILTILMTRNNYSVQKYVSTLKSKCIGIRNNLITSIRN